MPFDILRFRETYFEMIWGGHRLGERAGVEEASSLFERGRDAASTLSSIQVAEAKKTFGEAWLIADHAACESVVAEGPREGRTLRELMDENATGLLGTRPKPTAQGRFPLLLKLLDAAQPLSVQVHPDDAAAARLGEPDVGKTEMWHVLDAAPGAELICGLDPAVNPESCAQAFQDGGIEKLMCPIESAAGTSVFVPAGTVHAIGAGIFLAEIQQNSNITYRIYDWGRVDAQGRPRDLHIGKALQVIQFGVEPPGASPPLALEQEGVTRRLLAACRHFAAERVQVYGTGFVRLIQGATFHILLGVEGELMVSAGAEPLSLTPQGALLVPGGSETCKIAGKGTFLDYYVPDLEQDIYRPLEAAGHRRAAILRLGGATQANDLLHIPA